MKFAPSGLDKTLLTIRVVFVLLCAAGGWLVCYSVPEWDEWRTLAVVMGLLLGVFVVLVDLVLKGFSLRGLSAVTFGLILGSLIAYLIGSSPLFENADQQTRFLSRLALFVICSYLGAVLALRGKDEFNVVIPYVRFVPQDIEAPLVVVDASALIDGRIARICESGFLGGALVIPRFVLHEIQLIADAPEPARQARGRRGLDTLTALRAVKRLDLRIHESEARRQEIDAKLVFVAQALRAKLLTTDYSLAKLAEFHGVHCLNLNELAQALRREALTGDHIEIELVKPGREPGQAVGYLDDGSMVVVADGRALIGQRITAEVVSVMASAGGRMVFARPLTPAA